MLINGFRKYTMNPALGLLPIGIFILLNANSVNLLLSLSISIVFSLVVDLIFHYFVKTSVFWLVTIISLVPLFLTSLFALFAPVDIVNSHNYMIICEICLVLTLYSTLSLKKYIISRYFKRIDIKERKLIQEMFSTMSLSEHLFTLHLFVVLAYSFLIHSYGFEGWDFTIYIFLPLAIIAAVIAYESFTLRALSIRLSKEEWLPIVNEQGWATGKIIKSAALKMKNRYMFPVVRVALIYQDSIYLQKRPENASFEPGFWDHPFEKYMLYKHEPHQSVCNCMDKLLNGKKLCQTYQFKYVFENKETKRLILFYISKIQDPEEINSTCLLNGKFWTVKQIEKEISSNIFGECFLHEFEYLKTTMLHPVLKNLDEKSCQKLASCPQCQG